MATLLLQAVGGLIGGALGPIGAAVGTAVGAAAGYYIDSAIINSTRTIEGSRLTGARPMVADEGTPVPRAFGYARISATVIWTTRFEEERRSERQGAKGGPKIVTYSYYGNLALGLCEGPAAHVKRIWADGKELDLRDLNWRLYKGDEDQLPDTLIEAKQGAGNAPAYRGLAYIVFERLPLEQFGNRIPQFQVEIVRPIGELENQVRAVALIPGSTEHGLAPFPVTKIDASGATIEANRHVLHADNDWQASVDELLAVCPGLRHVSLIVTWFCGDLRAGDGKVRPGIVERNPSSESSSWQVSGLSRSSSDTHVASMHDGTSAFGGTPNDASVLAAIADLKARGIGVTLCPFIMMDIPDGNAKPDPWGSAEQAVYPWRGRITCHPAAGQPGSADATAAADTQVAAFVGSTGVDDIVTSGSTVSVSPSADFGYRRMILHYAKLAVLAGGVDTMVIGSELRGLTQIRGANGGFPFVQALKTLAADVRTVVGTQCNLTYGADWSEYFGYQPSDGSNDVFYNLDPLWADANIDAIGIDNYMPLSDWRANDSADKEGNPDGMKMRADVSSLAGSITSGEGYDWYYASEVDRQQRIRTPISDGAYGKPWVYRYKDLKNWWGNLHHERQNGVEAANATDWVPGSKPIWFMELGCPAVRCGANQPNVFGDPKSSESALPYFSDGTRADDEQRAFLEAHHKYWRSGTQSNPVSALYGGPMVDVERLYLWAWDARPFPAFPLNRTQWADGDNWLTGHWLNGRLGTVPVREFLDLWGHNESGTQGLAGSSSPSMSGLVITGPVSAREVIEPVLAMHAMAANDTASTLNLDVQASEAYSALNLPAVDRVEMTELPSLETLRGTEGDLPREVVVTYRDILKSYASATAYSRRMDGDGLRQLVVDLPAVLDPQLAKLSADRMLAMSWAGREVAKFSLPLSYADLEPGAVVAFDDRPDRHWVIERMTLTSMVEIEARSIAKPPEIGFSPTLPGQVASSTDIGSFGGPPQMVFADLPLLGASSDGPMLHVGLYAHPETAQLIFASPENADYQLRQAVRGNATLGYLTSDLGGGPAGRMDNANAINVTMRNGSFSSVSTAQLLAGANRVAIRSVTGVWEIVQFSQATEFAANQWQLTGLLRGLLGTEDATFVGAATGAPLLVLDEHLATVTLEPDETGLDLYFRAGPSGKEFSDRYYATAIAAGGVRAQSPFAPVHLRALQSPSGSLILSWVRRGRVNGDSWLGTDIPLGEETEAYDVRLFMGSTLAGQWQASEQRLELDSQSVQQIFGQFPQVVDFEVTQISAHVGAGIAARKSVTVQ